MTLIAYPFDAQNITEADYGQLIGASLLSGVVGSPATNHFRVTTSSGMQLTVTAVSGASLALVRGHALLMTSNELVTVQAADSAARVDLVVLQLNYATNTITPVVRKGTAGSTVAPTPVWGTAGVYEFPLATVAVAGGTSSISASAITDRRQFTGATIGAWPSTQRPTGRPAIGYNLTTNVWEATTGAGVWTAVALADHTLDSHGGTLSVAKGGTGGTTPVTAQKGLEIYAQATSPGHSPGRIWIKL